MLGAVCVPSSANEPLGQPLVCRSLSASCRRRLLDVSSAPETTGPDDAEAFSSFVPAFLFPATYKLKASGKKKKKRAATNAFAGGLGPTGSRWHVSLQREQPPAEHPPVVRKQFSRAAWIAYFWSPRGRPSLCRFHCGGPLFWQQKCRARWSQRSFPALFLRECVFCPASREGRAGAASACPLARAKMGPRCYYALIGGWCGDPRPDVLSRCRLPSHLPLLARALRGTAERCLCAALTAWD